MVMVSDNRSGNLNGFMQFPTMTVSENIMTRKFKIKLASKEVAAEPRKESCELGQQVFMKNGCIDSFAMNGEGKYEMNNLHKSVVRSFNEQRLYASDGLKVKLHMLGQKCGHPGGLDCRKEKRQKVDRAIRQQCTGILKTLMTHRFGWIFNQPVDPVALNIPDYFSIISDPMDLGTIKNKLEANLYLSIEEFAADVRLTFSNAMLYNPPSNDVHHMAKELSNVFNRRWKLLEAKCNTENTSVEKGYIFNGRVKNSQDMRHNHHKNPLLHVNVLPKRPISSEEKQKLKRQLVEVSRGKMTEKLQSYLQKLGLISKEEEKVEVVDIDIFDEETLLELERLMKDSLDATAAKVEPTKVTQNGGCSLFGKNLKKGTHSGRSACASAKIKPSLSSVASICGSCCTLTCKCRIQNDLELTSFSDLSSERPSTQDHQSAYKKDREVKAKLALCMSEDGAISVMDKENFCPSPQISTSATTDASEEAWTPLVDVQLSPKKALRAAMLKSRFADTILKARQKTLLDHGDKPDPVKMRQEKERLERQQHEETARIEAQIRAAEASSQRKAEAELKMQREREREAARIALQKMEKTVSINENQEILKDLEMLTGSPSDSLANGGGGSEVGSQAFGGCSSRKLLEQLGLFIKEDDYAEMEYEDGQVSSNGEGEEGEIMS